MCLNRRRMDIKKITQKKNNPLAPQNNWIELRLYLIFQVSLLPFLVWKMSNGMFETKQKWKITKLIKTRENSEQCFSFDFCLVQFNIVLMLIGWWRCRFVLCIKLLRWKLLYVPLATHTSDAMHVSMCACIRIDVYVCTCMYVSVVLCLIRTMPLLFMFTSSRSCHSQNRIRSY